MFKEEIGISNLGNNKFIKNSSKNDFKTNFAGVHLSHKINFFVNFYNLMREKGS